MSWFLASKTLPDSYVAVDVTLKAMDGTRFLNVGYLDPAKNWHLLIEKHHYLDCHVIAWKRRTDIYEGDL